MIIQHTSQKTVTTNPHSSEAALLGLRRKRSPVVAVEEPLLQKLSSTTARSDCDETGNTVTHRLPPNVDPEVFRLLPEEIQKELLSPAYANSLPGTSVSSVAVVDVPNITKIKSPQSFTDSKSIKEIKKAVNKSDPSDRATTMNLQRPVGTNSFPGENVMDEERLSFPQSSDCEFPGNVDPKVFSELPPDVQRELMSEWKQQKPILKTPSSRKTGRSSTTKDRKAAGKDRQANNLLKYFKPN